MDVITCFAHPEEAPKWESKDLTWRTAKGFYDRKREIHETKFIKESLTRIIRGYPDIDFRLTVVPSKVLDAGGFIPINASADELLGEMQLGFHDGT